VKLIGGDRHQATIGDPNLMRACAGSGGIALSSRLSSVSYSNSGGGGSWHSGKV
jgi:hypothetical protein